MRVVVALTVTLILGGACSRTPVQSQTPAAEPCPGTRVLIVQNGAEEAVKVFAVNGRDATEIGAVAPGRKEITVPTNQRATSFYAVAVSRLVIGGSVMSAPADNRVIFQLQCR